MLHGIMCFLKRNGNINENNESIVELGVNRLIGYLEDSMVCFLIGACLGVLIPAFVFQLSFILLRVYAGGYHADSQKTCKVISIAVTILCICFIRVDVIDEIFYLIAGLLSWGGIIIKAPIESINRPLNQNEKKVFKKRTVIIASLELLGCVICYWVNPYILKALAVALVAVCAGLEAVLVLGQKNIVE